MIDEKELCYGKILVKCKLIDCVLMDEKYIEFIKKNQIEYLSGIYESGRYAWILDEIKVIDKPIEAIGKLGIWNLK